VCSMTGLVRCFYLTVPHPFAVSCQNPTRNLKILRRVPVDLPRFRRDLTAVLKGCVAPIWLLLASMRHLTS
jgi:hypothetical protein